MAIEVRVPTLGESVSEATVASWFKKPGDMVAADEMLCELETDKVTVEVPAPAAGILGEIVAKEGETVGVNALLAMINEAGAAAAAPAAKSEGPAAPQTAAPQSQEVKMTDVMVPALGESVSEATVSTWFKKVGDAVAQDEMLCELETDKVSVEVPSPVAGVLTEIIAPEGATVAASAKLAVVAEGAAGSVAAPAQAPAVSPAAAPAAMRSSTDSPHNVLGAAPCEADRPAFHRPRNTHPPTQSDPVAAAPARAPDFSSRASREKVIVSSIVRVLTVARGAISEAEFSKNTITINLS